MENKPYIYYIAGKISGEDNYRRKFKAAEDRLRNEGFLVLNPSILPDDLDDYEAYIDIGFAMLRNSDGIYMLNGWHNSPGAKRELFYAQAINKDIRWEKDDVRNGVK